MFNHENRINGGLSTNISSTQVKYKTDGHAKTDTDTHTKCNNDEKIFTNMKRGKRNSSGNVLTSIQLKSEPKFTIRSRNTIIVFCEHFFFCLLAGLLSFIWSFLILCQKHLTK